MTSLKKLIFYSIFVFIIVASIAIKIFLIFTYPMDLNEPFFVSRANSINQGKVLFTGNLFMSHGPLTSYFLSAYSKIFGLSTISVHFAAFILDIFTFLLIIFLTYKYFGKKECIVSSAIYLVLSTYCGATFYSSENVAAFFGLLGLTFYLLFLEKNKYYLLFFSGIVIGISLWAKQPGILFFIAIVIHQAYLYFKKNQSFKGALKNIILASLGSLLVSIPLLIYFFYYSGWEFLKQLILFNLFFTTRHSRIIIIGKLLKMLLVLFGFLFAIILSAPKKQEETRPKIYSALFINCLTMLLFYFINRELFEGHFLQFFPPLILLTFFYIKKYPSDFKKLIYVIIIISISALLMVSLEAAVRGYQDSLKQKQMDVANYLMTLPSDANYYLINTRYSYLSGRESSYRYTVDLGPNAESLDKFEDFCDYLNTVDYMLITDVQVKYLGQKNIECINSKFTVIKTFENIGDMGTIEILKKNS